MHRTLEQRASEAWADMIGSIDWHHFVTVTYAIPVHATEKVERDWRRFVFLWQMFEAERRGDVCVERHERSGRDRLKLSGPWWNRYRRGHHRPQWVVGVENHRDGKLHAHGLVRWTADSVSERFALATKAWHHEMKAGFVVVEEPRRADRVAAYVAKYAMKGGDVVVSPNLNTPRMFASPTPQNASCS